MLGARSKCGASIRDPAISLSAAIAASPSNPKGSVRRPLHGNIAILLCVRYAVARRSNIGSIRIDHVDRGGHHLELDTKNRREGNSPFRLPLFCGNRDRGSAGNTIVRRTGREQPNRVPYSGHSVNRP
jgi:hypothetical protein